MASQHPFYRTAQCISIWLLISGTAIATTNIASWQGLRGTQVQSTIVLEGGRINNGTWDGTTWKDSMLADSSYGVYYHINLTKDFDAMNDNTDSYMTVPDPGRERDDPNGPNFLFGGIFNNYYQFCTFGGIADKSANGADTVILGKLFSSGTDNTRADPGIVSNPTISGNVNQSTYIAAGAYASAPDQGLGFYFSGMVGASRGELDIISGDTDPNHPTVTDTSIIRVDMSVPDQPSFNTMQWPTGFTPRVEGALVWLPYGAKGVLVAIGGTEIPGDLYLLSPPRDYVPDGPFMTELAIYDIDGDTWYTQNTTAAPGASEQPSQTAEFCTVVVPSQDNKSQEIFVYGGYDGTYNTSFDVRDDVWVLSVPAFQWTKVLNSELASTHGRQGNVCFAPNPTTLITVGGSTMLGAPLATDLIVDVLDLNNMTWTHKYNSSSAEPFQPSYYTQLGWDNANGPGDKTVALGSDPLTTLFSTPYAGQVRTYYPYSSNGTQEGNSTGTGASTPVHKKNKWKVPLIATLCTVIPILLLAALLFCCLRRHRKNKAGSERTQRSRRNVFSWLSKPPVDPEPEKSNSSGDTAVESHPENYFQPSDKAALGEVHEAPGDNVPRGVAGVTSPSHGRHEIMDHPQRESTSIRDHPYYPRSISGNHINTSVRSDSLSQPSGVTPSSRGTALQTTPSELPEKKSRENLPPLPSDMNAKLDQHHHGGEVSAATGMAPGSAMPRKAVGERRVSSPEPSPVSPRPGHHRNQSSLSDGVPSLPSPEPREDWRQSRHVDALPDVYRQVTTKGSGRISAYKENI